MLEGLIRDIKVQAMGAVGEVKDMLHDATTKLPDEKPISFEGTTSQQIPVNSNEMGYMNCGWGGMPAQMTANRIDMIVEKMSFVSDMIQNGLLSFDSIETELRALASQPVPPQPAQLIAIAGRIDASQKQTFMGLQKLKELAIEVDRATDKLQGGAQASQSGWGAKGINQGGGSVW